ncbi:cell wall hydrolase [Acuticoccus sp. I52.16.1]|uniref:cell wall hydrolase n=1 Tax=Acuticoccus sp. I52.16.1 TaxID=2928472 RepID=UPI001FD3F4B3|nr:cell wall hydrolase [Acuticoccus sp. I52.16.1]UOM35867.1 cell wall hydrolase [Acuticoccus sp. I52.16.1]
MRLTDLPQGSARVVPGSRPIFIPGPAPRRRPGRFLLRTGGWIARTAALSATVLVAMGATVGDQGLTALLTEGRPSWAPALQAADPGVALSPHVAFADGTVAALPSTLAAAEARKGDSLNAPAPGGGTRAVAPVDSLLAAASPETFPRVAFVRPRKADPVPAAKQRPARTSSRLAEAALTSMYSAYMPERVTIETPFALLFQDPKAGAATAAGLTPGLSGNGLDHWWSDRPLPSTITSDKSLKCLAEAVYFEARGEGMAGQEAVAQVVVNRVKNPTYPDDVCGVVYQNRRWYNRCQFTFACDRIKDVVRDPEAWAIAEDIAGRYARGETWHPEIGAATHYHADSVSPSWANLMRAVKTIDHHTFYMTRNGGWT